MDLVFKALCKGWEYNSSAGLLLIISKAFCLIPSTTKKTLKIKGYLG